MRSLLRCVLAAVLTVPAFAPCAAPSEALVVTSRPCQFGSAPPAPGPACLTRVTDWKPSGVCEAKLSGSR